MNRSISVRLASPASALVFWSIISAAALMAQAPDVILRNGKVLTADDKFTIAQAVAVTGNKITAVGSDDEVSKLAGPGTKVLDLKGRTVVPGLIDTHRHIDDEAVGDYGKNVPPEQMRNYPVDWRGVSNKDDVLNQIKTIMDKYKFKPGEWIHFNNQLQFSGTKGTDQAKIIYDELSRWDLDKVTPDNPVILNMGVPEDNGLFINSNAYDIVWAKYGDFIKKNGRYWIDAGGRADGHLEPPATRILEMIYEPQAPADVLAPLFRKKLDELNSMGVTTVSSKFPTSSVATWKLLESKNELTIRIPYGMQEVFGTVTDLNNGLKQYQGKVGTGTDKVWVDSIAPSNVDGSGSRNCMTIKRNDTYGAIDGWWPMGQCHYDIEFRGAKGKAAPIQDNYYKNWAFAAGRYGIRFANTHVAGDRSVALLLGIIDDIQKQMGPNATQNWALDHCTFVNPADIPLAARLKVMFSCAPKYMEDNGPAAVKAYGEKIANTWIVPVKSMLDAGMHPVFEMDREGYAWRDLQLYITRKDKQGRVWGPQERIDRVTALRMATRWAADYVLRGSQLGSIETNKLADLVVLDQDYMTVPEDQIETITPQMTMFDGRIVFVHPQFSQEYNLKPDGAVVSTYKDLLSRHLGKGDSMANM